jgi:hypothetical protein
MSQSTLPLFTLYDEPSLKKNDGLLRVFEDIHNHIYANDGLSPEQALEETIKILFLKIFDEKNKTLEFKISSAEYDQIKNGGASKDFLNRFQNLQKNTFKFFANLFEKVGGFLAQLYNTYQSTNQKNRKRLPKKMYTE